MERPMANNKNISEKQPGEKKADGKFHYNPGNMSGKTIESCKGESEQQNNADRIRSRRKQQDQKP
jgi:hypothetical protein